MSQDGAGGRRPGAVCRKTRRPTRPPFASAWRLTSISGPLGSRAASAVLAAAGPLWMASGRGADVDAQLEQRFEALTATVLPGLDRAR